MKEKRMTGLFTRSAQTDLNTRALSLALDDAGTPASLNEEARTVEVVAATEAPVMVWDWMLDREVPEILLMSGLKLPASRQVPLQDSHERYSVKSTLGSARDMRVAGDEVVATVHFSGVTAADDAFRKVKEGHITDFSVGWRLLKVTRLNDDETAVIGGRSFTGPARIVTSWQIKELSIVPIGADERAKARSETKTDIGGTKTMNKKLKDLLIARGMKADATDAEALSFMVRQGIPDGSTDDEAIEYLGRSAADAGGAQPAPRGNLDPAELARQAAAQAVGDVMRAETRRQTEIRALCDKFGCSDLANNLIVGNSTIDEARAAVLDHLGQGDPAGQVGVPAGGIRIGAEAGEKYRSAVAYALISRSGMQVPDLKAAPGYEDFKGRSLGEIARICLRQAGQDDRGDLLPVIGRALTTSDLPSILADVANKSLFAGFAAQQETFELWTDSLPVSDFKALNVVSISALDDLAAVSENGEFKYGYLNDKGETITLGTAGRIYPITRQALINDDINAITRVFAAAGQKAKKYEGDLVYAVLTTNAAMAEDSVTLFHSASHGNVGTDSLPDTDSLNEMDGLFGAQTGSNGEYLNIPMEFLIAPRGLWGSIETFFATLEYRDANNVTIKNIWNNRLQRVYDARLTGTGWYAAGPKGTTVVRTHLNGVKTPYMEQRNGWTMDGVELKVRYDVAAGAVDWRGLGYNAGR